MQVHRVEVNHTTISERKRTAFPAISVIAGEKRPAFTSSYAALDSTQEMSNTFWYQAAQEQ
jgi:hypothetical protein